MYGPKRGGRRTDRPSSTSSCLSTAAFSILTVSAWQSADQLSMWIFRAGSKTSARCSVAKSVTRCPSWTLKQPPKGTATWYTPGSPKLIGISVPKRTSPTVSAPRSTTLRLVSNSVARPTTSRRMS